MSWSWVILPWEWQLYTKDAFPLFCRHFSEEKEIRIKKENLELDKILAEALCLDKVTLIRCGGNDLVAGAREQWSDGANTLAIAPGEVIVYSRNKVTNSLLKDNGIKVHVMPSSELSRGRGGPRCMSMPLRRDDI